MNEKIFLIKDIPVSDFKTSVDLLDDGINYGVKIFELKKSSPLYDIIFAFTQTFSLIKDLLKDRCL